MGLKEKLKSYEGRILMSIVLGLGLATLFRQVCKGKNCVVFHSPKISKVKDKIFKHEDKCYTYSLETSSCNKSDVKKITFA